MRAALAIWVVLSSALCGAQTGAQVRVLVLDYKTGRPVEGRSVGLDTAGFSHWSVAKTDQDGFATFRLNIPLPEALTIDPEVTLANWSCSTQRQFQTSEVLERGATGGFEDHPFCLGHTAVRAVAQRGEIIVYTRHLTPWLAFRRFLHEATHG